MVIALATTGRGSRWSRAVTATDHTNSGIHSGFMLPDFILIVVEMKLTALRTDDIPAKLKEKIARSTDAPAWAIPLARGGYTVQPVPAPLSTILLASNKVSDGGSQNLVIYSWERYVRGS